jgi:outer membrane protein OmpA-like peptidoglycan-associated protein
MDRTPLYRVTVVQRTTKAVNYRHRGGATKVDFEGTPLMPRASGEAKVESKQGYIEIEVEFDELGPATQFGPEYLTYVMWAITPEGRATNLGEVLLNGNRSKLNVTTELQAFGLIVTAEPYFAVTQPSDVVVLENIIRRDTRGKVDEIDANYELLQRGQYTLNVNRSQVQSGDPRRALEVREARNAVQIAKWAGADKYATDVYQKAEALLRQSEDYYDRKQRKPAATVAREAVQRAEDARLITLQRMEAERQEMERRAAAEREAEAKRKAEEARLRAEDAARQRAAAEEQQRLEAERRAQAEQQRLQADQLRLQADQQRQAAEQEAARLAAARTAAEEQSKRLEAERLAAEEAARKAAEERAAAEAARQAAITEQQRLAQQAEQARLQAQEAERARATAEQERENLRNQLREQLNAVLETRDSARGLIVNMSDVLFDFNKATLRSGAREKLARISGIVMAHPSLSLQVEGHTDSVGSDEYNQKLSEKRAEAVREYLTGSGIPPTSVTARGLGETTPVASNDSAAGRQQNRRVELVVSGEAIGNKASDVSSVR